MKIVVIEDHKLIRDMLVVSCGMAVPGTEAKGGGTAAEGLALCREFQPEIVFLDLVLPDRDGLEIVPEILAVARQAKIVALTSHADEFTLHRALRANVHGFVDKNEQPLEVLKEAILTVKEGRPYFSSAVQRLRMEMRRDPTDFSKLLSEHEQKLLALIGEGLDNAHIAEKVGLSASTIKLHRHNIMNKLGIHSTPQLIHYALEKGFTRVKSRTNAPMTPKGEL